MPRKAQKKSPHGIRIKRIYASAVAADGRRILVDRIWPRGLSKERARIDDWLKEVAPSTELRKWFGHDPERWTEFKQRYRGELDSKTELLDTIVGFARNGIVTLVFSASDVERNQAVALCEVLRERLAAEPSD